MRTVIEPVVRGRPRDPQKDRDVLAATRELLAEVGYAGTTIAAVARRANVGAPTIYRRWARREELIEDAAFGRDHPAPLPTNTGDLRADLHAWVELFLTTLADPVTRAAVPGLLLAWQQDQTHYRQFRLRNEENVHEVFLQLIADYGVRQHAEAAFDFLVNTTLLRAVTLGSVDAEQYCARTADALAAMLTS